MNSNFVPVLLTAGVLAIATSTVANSADAPEFSISCQMVDGVHTTVAQSGENETQVSIFHWKEEALANRTSNTPEELCNEVSQELADYSLDYDFSNISFIGTAQGGLPTICANAGGRGCGNTLFTLDKTTEEPAVVAGNVVDAILAQNLQPEKSKLVTRGVQSISYQVNFWSLLGFGSKDYYKH
ncbi:MAG: COP23 domain-containing protein [Cyanobacteria bacterium J06621_12]